MTKVSVIIPTFNEAHTISPLLTLLAETAMEDDEVIISDGDSTDNTVELVLSFEEFTLHQSSRKGRAFQMNEAFEISGGEILYFIHADTLPPKTWRSDILNAVKAGHNLGGFRFKFNSKRPLLRFNSWMTRFNILSFRGGDQTIFITRDLFKELGKYPDWCIMEEYELLRQARSKSYRYKLIQKDVLVSARKYDDNSYVRVNLVNGLAMLRFRMGVHHSEIEKHYKAALHKRK